MIEGGVLSAYQIAAWVLRDSFHTYSAFALAMAVTPLGP